MKTESKRISLENENVKVAIDKCYDPENKREYGLDVYIETEAGVKGNFWVVDHRELVKVVDLLTSYIEMENGDE